MTMRARDAVMALLAAHDSGTTICPSEAARAITPSGDWRDAMPAVHAAVDRLLKDGLIRISWKGAPASSRTGPYRISKCESGRIS